MNIIRIRLNLLIWGIFMKKLSMSLLLIAIMILSISVVSATDADGFNDLSTAQDGTADVCAVDEEVGPIGLTMGRI